VAKQQHFYLQVAEFAHKMGADEAIVVGKGEIPQAPSSKLDILLSTVAAALDWVPYIDFLDSDGALAFVGVPDAPLSIPWGGDKEVYEIDCIRVAARIPC